MSKSPNFRAFTLAEVLITLAIIGIVAAISIPSVISNTQQQEYKTGLKKAVSVLNSAITMNIAMEGESPYDNANLFGYLMRHMSVMKSASRVSDFYYVQAITDRGNTSNAVFYTTDGMRFEIRAGNQSQEKFLYENPSIEVCTVAQAGEFNETRECGGCGSYGLNNNVDGTTKPPCLLTVDVNGDRKPNPNNVNCRKLACAKEYKYADPEGKILTDLFTIMITDKQAIPYGYSAQRAMYQAQNK